MTNQFHVISHPMFLYSGFSTTGKTTDLAPGVIGIFDGSNTALATAPTNPNEPLRLAQGSYHAKDALGIFYTKMKNTLKTTQFRVGDVEFIQKSPFRKRQHEEWILGYDGSSESNPLTFECGKTYKYRFRVFGQGVYDVYQKQIFRDVAVTTGCCDTDECADGCEDGVVHCKKYTEMLVNNINSDVEISKFVKAEPVFSTVVSHTPTHQKLSLVVVDNGDLEAMQDVARAFPTLQVERTLRKGSYSTYTTTSCIPYYKYIVATSAVNTSTEVITVNNHSYATGDAVIYNNGGGASIGGLTSGALYYVRKTGANTFTLHPTLADANANTNTINLTGTGNNDQFFTNTLAPFTPTVPVFEATCGECPAGYTLDDGMCSPSTSVTPINWVFDEFMYTITRTLKLVVEKDCGGTSRLADVQAFYAEDPTVVSIESISDNTCNNVFEMVQRSACVTGAGCLSEPGFTFERVSAFEENQWEVVSTEEAPDASFKCGIRFVVSSSYDQFGVCSWTPEDFYTYKPTFMEVWAIEEDGRPCKIQPSARKTRISQQENQNGEWARREYIRLAKYLYWDAFDNDQRLREVLDQTAYSMIKLNDYYNVYYFKYTQYRGNNRTKNVQNPEVFEIPILVKEGINVTAFEAWLNSVFGAGTVANRF